MFAQREWVERESGASPSGVSVGGYSKKADQEGKKASPCGVSPRVGTQREWVEGRVGPHPAGCPSGWVLERDDTELSREKIPKSYQHLSHNNSSESTEAQE